MHEFFLEKTEKTSMDDLATWSFAETRTTDIVALRAGTSKSTTFDYVAAATVDAHGTLAYPFPAPSLLMITQGSAQDRAIFARDPHHSQVEDWLSQGASVPGSAVRVGGCAMTLVDRSSPHDGVVWEHCFSKRFIFLVPL